MIAAISGALAVAIGAFGAHGLDTVLAEPGLHGDEGLPADLIVKRIDQFNVGVKYHLVHTVALMALAAINFGSRRIRMVAAWLLAAGIILFSGSLYALVLTNTPWLGAITPIGGLSWIAAWVALILVAVSKTAEPV